MANGRIKGITIEIDGSTTGLDKALKSTESNISSVQRSLKDVNRLLKIDPSNTELLSQKQKLLSQAVDETKQKLEMEKEALRQAAEQNVPSDKMDALKREVIATTQELEALEKQAKNAGSVLGTQLQESGKKITDAGNKISKVGDGLTKNVTLPIMAVGAASVAAWNQVDEGMDIVIAKTGATGDALREMQDIAKEIPQTINVGFDEAGEAVGEVNTRFGVAGDNLKNLSVQFLEFSKLNNADVSTSIDTTQKAMEAFNVSTDNAGAFLDTLNAVGQRTGIDVLQLASNMTTNAAALKEMGFNASDAANFLGDLEVSGIDTSTVMTGLKKALANAAAEGKPMNQALAEVQSAMTNATSSEEAMQYAMELFGTKAGPAIAEACANGQLSFDNLGTSIEDNLGNVEETFNNTQDPIDSFQTTLNTIKVVGSDLADTLGQMLVPMLKELGTKAQELKAKWDGLSEGQQQMIIKIAMAAMAIGPLISMIGGLVSTVGTITSGIGSLISFFSGLSGAAGAAGAGITLFSGPLLPIVGIIAGVVTAGVLLYKNWDTIKEKAGQLKEELSNKFSEIKQSASEKWTSMKEEASEKWDSMTNTVTEKLSSMKQGAASKYSEIKQKAKDSWSGMKQDMSSKLSEMKASYDAHGGGLKGAVSATLTGVHGLYTAKYNAIDTLTGGKLSAISYKFSTNMQNAKASVSSTLANISSSFNSGLSGAFSTASSKLGSIGNKFSSTMSNARKAVSDAISNIRSKFNFSWSLPKLKLPHISITGKFSINPPSVPKFGISWYKKAMESAMIMTGPTAFGYDAKTNSLLAGGEAGNEVLTGEGHLVDLIDNAVGNWYSRIGYQLDILSSVVQQYFPRVIENMDRDIVLDDGTLVGRMASKMDDRLGIIVNHKERGN